ncbi:MAG TPA: four helix bundle protein [Bacteroidales bacterium]|nr:four helix bundle protein [Bacteroidales bacterium]
MDNKDFGNMLERRTKMFALRIINLSSEMSDSIENKIIRNQIVKSGTSIGANYREANKSRSKADFRNKIKICLGEANETIYWLELMLDSARIDKTKGLQIYNECQELVAIFTSIVQKLVKR